MKILAFNCSPRTKRSNTDRILGPLLEGAVRAGTDVEKVYVKKLDIAPCSGCLTCWFKTPGVCAKDDDRLLALAKMAESDLIIYGTPLYYFNMTVYMKNLLERIGVPLIHPYFIEVDGRLCHPVLFPNIKKKMVLVANGLLWGDEAFSPLIDTFEGALTHTVDDDGNPAWELAGRVLVGCGEMLGWEELKGKLGPFFENLRGAGEELVSEGRLSTATEKRLGVPVWSYLGIDSKQAVEMIHERADRLLEKAV